MITNPVKMFSKTMGSLLVFISFIPSGYSVKNLTLLNYLKTFPEVIYKRSKYELFTLGDVNAESAVKCAAQCASNALCQSFFFKEPEFLQERCYKSTTRDYAGFISDTYDGRPCDVRWDENHQWVNLMSDTSFPDGSMTAANTYCRDPLGDGYLWCPMNDIHMNWDSCNIPKCMTSNCRIYAYNYEDDFDRVNTEREGMSLYVDVRY